MLAYFPLIYLPPSMTAAQLLREKPFLWFNIMTVATRSFKDQMPMSSAIKEHVARVMVAENQKGLDLLLGLLVYLGW